MWWHVKEFDNVVIVCLRYKIQRLDNIVTTSKFDDTRYTDGQVRKYLYSFAE